MIQVQYLSIILTKQTWNCGCHTRHYMHACSCIITCWCFTSQVRRVGGCMCYDSTGLFSFTHPPSSETSQWVMDVKCRHKNGKCNQKWSSNRPHKMRGEHIHRIPIFCDERKRQMCYQTFQFIFHSVMSMFSCHVCCLFVLSVWFMFCDGVRTTYDVYNK